MVAIATFAGAHGVVGAITVCHIWRTVVGGVRLKGRPSNGHVHWVTRGQESVDWVMPAEEPVVERLRQVWRGSEVRHQVARHEGVGRGSIHAGHARATHHECAHG